MKQRDTERISRRLRARRKNHKALILQPRKRPLFSRQVRVGQRGEHGLLDVLGLFFRVEDLKRESADPAMRFQDRGRFGEGPLYEAGVQFFHVREADRYEAEPVPEGEHRLRGVG